MKILNRKHILAAGVFLVAVIADTRTLLAQDGGSNQLSCSPFNSVYTPPPTYKKSDGIHYSMVIEDRKCELAPCVSANVHFNMYDATDNLLSRMTMRYECGGSGWVCQVSLPLQMRSRRRPAQINLDPVGLNKNFTQSDFLGDKNGKATYALILPGLGRRFRNLDWNRLKPNIEVFARDKDLTAMQFQFMPDLWLLSKCSR